jgi:release factor glutamine methyltransferase
MGDSDHPKRSAPAPLVASSGSGGGQDASDRRGAWTLAALLQWTQTKFQSAGISNARLDAEHLLAFAIGCSRMTLYVEHDRPVDDAQRARFRELVKRRLAREPVAYIEGKRGFHALDLELAVDRRVLVPRPETEHLVDWVLEDLAAVPVDASASVVDVGTGSGAIALAIKHRRGDLHVTAVDVSTDALDVARANAQRLAIDVAFVHSDLLASVSPPAGGWRAVAANLPYIATAELATLEPEVSVHEPRLALDGGTDGLDLIRPLLEQVAKPGVLADGGAVYLEVGYDQAARVADLVRAHGLVADVRADHSRVPRVVRGRREHEAARA